MKQILPGKPEPLGATFDGSGVGFAIFSEAATRVDLCLFDAAGNEERLTLPRVDAYTWHGYVPGLGPGQRYGFRAYGPYDPAAGHRFNPQKLLIDPYAKAIDGRLRWDPAVFGYRGNDPNGEPNTEDSAPFVPKSLVVDSAFDWEGDAPLARPWQETLLYEVHVKGFTAAHPRLSPALRGTFAGFTEPSVIEHLSSLGVTAVELLPVFQIESEHFLQQRGLSNYWGYNTLGYFAPHNGYASATGVEVVTEFKRMVKALHRAGIEVILDVVYNHTCEGDIAGPTLAFRGLDNRAVYRHATGEPGRYFDYTGCGNTLNVQHPQVLRLIMDSLRYWVTEMHVDGFRFDLATVLARGTHRVNLRGKFMAAIHQDPILRNVKLIAEPWDLGEGGYHVGQYPPPWSEWNGKFRDSIRDFWRGYGDNPGELMARFSGSADLYQRLGHRPRASVNLVTAHDGFTLHDLVSYNQKHNQANGEENRDGESYNRSWNSGVEGPTDDAAINALRNRRQRSLLATLLLAVGTPMLTAGDELGRSQNGNNNPYCQDNEITWFDWKNWDGELLDFARKVATLRRAQPTFRRSSFGPVSPDDLRWFAADGSVIDTSRWHGRVPFVLALFLEGHECSMDEDGKLVSGDSYLIAFNATHETVDLLIPLGLGQWSWQTELDSGAALLTSSLPGAVPSGGRISLAGYSLRLLRRRNHSEWAPA